MITPSFSPTATERVLPKLALDFTTASLDPRVTFTRTLDTATCVNSSGYVQTVAANTPRFDYNSATLSCNGLLIEEARTNLYRYSNQFDNNLQWVINSATVVPFSGTSPDGTNNAYKLILNNGVGGANTLRQNYGYTNGQVYTFSIYAKKGEFTSICFRDNAVSGGFLTVDLTNGSISNGTSGTFYNPVATLQKDSWYRISFTWTSNGNAGPLAIAPNATGDGVKGIYIYGAQSELGAFATSYINTGWSSTSTTSNDITTGTKTFTIGLNSNVVGQAIPAGAVTKIWQTSNSTNYLSGTVTSHTGTSLVVSITTTNGSGTGITDWTVQAGNSTTRNADVATMTGTNFSDWFNATQGTFTAKAAQYHTYGASLTVLSINAGADYPRMTMYRQAAGSINGFVKTTGSTQATLSCGVSQTVNTFWTQAQAYNQSTSYYSVNAASPVSSNISLTGLTFTDMTFGNSFVGAGAYFNGWIAKVTYYPQQLTNAQLQAISK